MSVRAAAALAAVTARLVKRHALDAETSARELLHVVAPLAKVNLAVELTGDQLAQLEQLVCRRENNEPLQYIVGSWDFRQLQGMETRAPVLCPRPETEELAELAEALLSRRAAEQSEAPVNFLEIGCGSGAISISLLHNISSRRSTVKMTAVRGMAVDISSDACDLTMRNAARFGVKAQRCSAATPTSACLASAPAASAAASTDGHVSLRVLQADALRLKLSRPALHEPHEATGSGWVEVAECQDKAETTADRRSGGDYGCSGQSAALPRAAEQQHGVARFDMLVANPPYIPDEDDGLLHPQVRQFEDPRALFGGAPLGAGFTLALLDSVASAGLLAPGADVLLEVDSIHPALFADVLQPCDGGAVGSCSLALAKAETGAVPTSHAQAEHPCCFVRKLHSATGFALPHEGFDGKGSQAVISRDWALLHDWWARRADSERQQFGVSPAAPCVDAARAAWETAIFHWKPRLSSHYRLLKILADLYGRPRFVHLRKL